jgi:hypothetical protein
MNQVAEGILRLSFIPQKAIDIVLCLRMTGVSAKRD